MRALEELQPPLHFVEDIKQQIVAGATRFHRHRVDQLIAEDIEMGVHIGRVPGRIRVRLITPGNKIAESQ